MKTLRSVLSLILISSCFVNAQTPSPFILDANTVALWHLNESSGTFVRDSTSLGNHGNAFGTTITTGRFGNARALNGFSDYISVSDPSNGSLDFGTTQSFTVDVWFKTTTQTGFLLRKGLAPTAGYDLSISNGRVQGEIGNREDSYFPDTLIRIRSTQTYNDGQWHLASLERNRASGKIYLFVDGIQAATPLNDPIIFPISSDRPLTLGKWENNLLPTYFAGVIDEVRISNIARHALPIVSDTVALWHYDEISGNTVFDSSPYRNSGVAFGTTIGPGVIGNARYFNGTGDYVNVPNPTNGSFNFSPDQSFTIDLWFKTTTTVDGSIIRRGLAPVPGFHIAISSGRLFAEIGNREDGNPPDTLLRIFSDRIYTDGQWHHATYIRDRAVHKLFLYVDGVLDATPINDNFPIPLVSDRPLTMGRWEVIPTYFKGYVDEVGIFKGARHPVTVVSDTIALWHYDEITGAAVQDASPYSNHGTAFGTTIVPGRFGNARYFPGTGYVYVPNPVNRSFNMNPDQSFTIDLWFKNTVTNDGWLLRRGLAPVPGFSMGISSGRLLGEVGNREDGTPPDTVLMLFSNRTYRDGLWHHAVFVRDRSIRKLFLYVDGVSDATPINDNFPIPLVNNRPLTMGRWETLSQSEFFTGYLDEVAIYRGARHPAGSGVPIIEVSPPQLNFGNVLVGTNAMRDVTVRNVGFADTLRVTGISSNNPLFASNISTFSLPPGNSRTVQVTYTPSAARTDTGSLSISSNDTTRRIVRLALSGNGFTATAAPLITSIRDIPEDQGKQVRVTWYKSRHDSVGDSLRIGTYSVWRRVGSNNTLWDFIESIPAVRFTQYSYVSPTLFDSSRTTGIRWSVFRVSAHTVNGVQVYFSPSDSGYSVDNLAPFAPTNLAASFGGGRVNLGWVAPPDPDVQSFGIHRSTTPNFVPSTANQIGTSNTASYIDQSVSGNPVYYYCVTAFDTTGNQSGPSNQVLVQITDAGNTERLPGQFQLYQNYPNPFNPTAIVRYDIANESRVTIQLYDMLGREVLTLVDENKTAGRYEVHVNAQNLSSGVYMYRMQAGSYSSLKKMILMK